MIDYDALNFTGPLATHTLISGEGWVQKHGSYLLDAAMRCDSGGSIPGKREMVGKTELTGLQVRQNRGHEKRDYPAAQREVAALEANPDTPMRLNRSKCRRKCGGMVSVKDTLKGYVLCQRCRTGCGRPVKMAIAS